MRQGPARLVAPRYQRPSEPLHSLAAAAVAPFPGQLLLVRARSSWIGQAAIADAQSPWCMRSWGERGAVVIHGREVGFHHVPGNKHAIHIKVD